VEEGAVDVVMMMLFAVRAEPKCGPKPAGPTRSRLTADPSVIADDDADVTPTSRCRKVELHADDRCKPSEMMFCEEEQKSEGEKSRQSARRLVKRTKKIKNPTIDKAVQSPRWAGRC
jgi:hypothetical protein